MYSGFFLTNSYRIENGRPVVQCHGRLQDDRTFVWRDHGSLPHFFVRTADWQRSTLLKVGVSKGVHAVVPSSRCTMAGEAVSCVEVAVPADVPPLRDQLHAQGIATYEADVRYVTSRLMDARVKGLCRLQGVPTDGKTYGVDLLFEDAELAPEESRWLPRLSMLAFDIETDLKATRLLAVSMYAPAVDEVLVLAVRGRTTPNTAIEFADERALMRAFIARVREIDPDVITGWNVIDFDLTVLERIAQRLGVRFELGRGPGAMRVRPARGYFGRSEAQIPGRVVLDGIGLLQGSFVRFEEYGLDAVAQRVLGEGKRIDKHAAGNRALEIMRMFREDRAAFVDYARTDARLAYQIVDTLKLVPLAVERACLTGMTPDRVAASVASFEYVYMTEMHRRGFVAPTVDSERGGESQAGGHVLEPTAGLWRNVLVFDFKSLYPSLMRTFNIDPLGFRDRQDADKTLIEAPNGAAFARESAILPGVLDALFARRERAKREKDGITSQAIKILMNSFYGVLGTPGCRFYNPAIANAITGFGRYFLLFSKRYFEERGLTVLYGDTDSLFVASGVAQSDDARALGPQLAAALNDAIRAHISERWQLESKLEVEFEKCYAQLHLPAVRHGTAGARKRYVGMVDDEIEFVGMEVVRRDWTELAKRVQRGLYERLFRGQAVDDYLKELVFELRAGTLDELLIYRKGLRKSIDDYTASTPPHVAAARKREASAADAGFRRSIAYVMTTDGPEPADDLRHSPDREHYIEKQIRPVAEPILQLLNLNFEEVAGLQRQMNLF